MKEKILDYFDYYKIATYIPEEFLEKLMDNVNSNSSILYKNYDYVFSYYKVTGTWRPLDGANPYLGEKNKIEKAEEIKIEFLIKKDDLDKVIKKIKEIHPYEQPAIDVYPVLPGFIF
ncbi:MAG: divalent cation tolerance protein CutA [Spirochaetes bacterium]|nr:divalent cation tolerance protein CutA [Spirochaetota bacterium]